MSPSASVISNVLLLSSTFVGAASATEIDILALAQARQSLPGEMPLQIPEEKEVLGSYLFVRSGVNILQNPTANPIDFTVGGNFGLEGSGLPPNVKTPFRRGSLRAITFQVDDGLDLALGIGLKLAPDLAVEFETGFQWNKIRSIEADLQYVVDDEILMQDLTYRSRASGGTGDIYQVPLMMNLLYDVEVVEDLRLSLGAGAGLQWTSFSSSSIVSSRYPGALLSEPDPMNPAMSIYYPVPLQIDASGQAISFRAQIQASLSYRLFSGVHLGAYIRYSGSSIADLGALTFQESPNNLYRDSGDIDLGGFRNLGIGLTLSAAF